MMSWCHILFLSAIALFILLSGCIDPGETVTEPPQKIPLATTANTDPVQVREIPVVSTPPDSPTPSPTITYCPDRGNESPWITLAPVHDVTRGEEMTIQGETNLAAGKTIEIRVMESSFHPHCKCCFDDSVMHLVRVDTGRGCNNTFVSLLDSTNLMPMEYMATATSADNADVSDVRFFNLYGNSTYPLDLPPGSPLPAMGNATLALDPVWDVKRGDVLVISGFTTSPNSAIRYFLRDARYSGSCRYSCPDELAGGIMHPNVFGDVQQPFSLRFNTTNLKPGRYLFHAEVLCYGETAEKSFNIVSGDTV